MQEMNLLSFLHILVLLENAVAWNFGSSSLNRPYDNVSAPAELTRRRWLGHSGAAAGFVLTLSSCPSNAAAIAANDELPGVLKKLTKLAPLGTPQSLSNKSYNLPMQELVSRLSNDLVSGATSRGGYFLTGDLSPDFFRDNCTFTDPTNSVSSLSQYQNALRILFDPDQSYIEIVKPLVVDDDTRSTIIRGTIRSRGVLKFPWHPQISSYESEITYRVGEADGLIYEQSQKWTKSSAQALRESSTPSLFTPPPKSSLPRPADEPRAVTRLFEYVNGRRPNSFSDGESAEISSLVGEIVDKRYPWKRDLLPGTWMLTYLQPGPDGGGIDRRIPFPELPFNDNFQIFGSNKVTNVGEIFGPLIDVKVSGTLREENERILNTPKRFVAQISEGQLCWRESTCLPLPISGEGIFDGMYVGERLRIGQNVNGGGARVVQVRLT